MIYRFPITTPANTVERDALRTPLKLGKGIIHKLDIYYPPGAQMLHHLRILKGVHQYWPTNPDQAFASDKESIVFREHLELKVEPYELFCLTWNEDTKNAHTLVVRIGLLRKKYIAPWLLSWREKTLFGG